MIPYLFVLVPVVLYAMLFTYETYASFNRIGKTGKSRAYLDATWEVTHTFLIIGLTNFIWLFSSAATEISKSVYWGLILFGFFFIVRAIIYVYLFYVSDNPHHKLLDWLFALSHAGMLATLTYALVKAISTLAGTSYSINTQFIPWMIPGLILMLALGALPVLHLYKTRD